MILSKNCKKNADKKQTNSPLPLTIWVTIGLQEFENDGRINSSNTRVWIQTIFALKQCIKTWCKVNATVNAYLITSFLILNVLTTVKTLTISMEECEKRKCLTKSWHS